MTEGAPVSLPKKGDQAGPEDLGWRGQSVEQATEAAHLDDQPHVVVHVPESGMYQTYDILKMT
jgi:hypothetical protein